MRKSSDKKPGAGKKRLVLNAKGGQAAAGLIVASAIASQAESTTSPSSLVKQPAPGKPEHKQSSKDTQHLDQLAAAFPVATDDEFAALVSEEIVADDGAQSAISDAQALLDELANEAGAPASGAEPILVAESTGITDVPVPSYGEPMLLAAADPAAASGGNAAAAGGEAAAGGAAATTTAGAFALPLPALAAIGAVAAVAAGGGGGGSSSSSSSGSSGSSSSGTVVDGLVKGATVFYDANNNNTLDPGEASTTTRADGSYTLSGYTVTPDGKIVVAAGGIDTFTGKPISTIMSAIADDDGTTTITPLTTLLASTSLTEAELKAALGIPASVDINDFDPYAAMQSSDAATKALGEQLFTLSQQIYTAVQAATQLQVTSGGASATAAASNVLNGVAAALKTVSALPSGQQSGQGLLDTISTFAVAAAAGVDVSAVQGSASALTSLNSSLASNTTASQVLNAVKTITETIGTAYDGLADKVASGGDTSQAQAIAALSQSLLLTSIQDNNAANLTTLGNSTSLNALVGQVADQIGNAGDGDLEGLDLDVPDITSITDAQAAELIAGGIEASEVFDSDALVTMEVQADGTHLTTSLKDLAALGVDFIAGGHGVGSYEATLGFGDGSFSGNLPQFDQADTVTLHVADGEAASGSLGVLADTGVDFIKAADGSLDIQSMSTSSEAGTLLNAGVRFFGGDQITAIESGGVHDLIDAIGGTNGQSGIDIIDMDGNYATTISEADAAMLIESGIHFAADDTNISMQAEGTHLSTSLKDLADLGVDHVLTDSAAAAVDAGDDDVVLDLGIDLTSGDASDALMSLLSNFSAPLFSTGPEIVVLEMDQGSYDALQNDPDYSTTVEQALVDLGVDFVKVVGSSTEDDLNN